MYIDKCTSQCSSALYKGQHFCDFLLASMDDVDLQEKWPIPLRIVL